MPPPPPPKPLKLIKSTNEGTLATNPRKRDELNRRIEETRRKLQSVRNLLICFNVKVLIKGCKIV